VQQRAPAPMLSAIRRRHSNRDEGIRAAYETGAYSYQEIARHFKVHFTTVGRIVRSVSAAERHPRCKTVDNGQCCYVTRPDPYVTPTP
jgi:DNA invertase Pin-like site-specific DNA recombinase